MEQQDLEQRRAANLIWNAAQNYALRPGYMAFGPDGRADLYFNSVIGAVYQQYDFTPLEEVLSSFEGKPNGALYSDLFWLGLENAVYPRALAKRPALAGLRIQYAKDIVRQQQTHPKADLLSRLRAAHFLRVLGQPDGLSGRDARLLDALEFSPQLTSRELAAQMEQVLARFFFTGTSEGGDGLLKVRFPSLRWSHKAQLGGGSVRRVGSGGGAAGGAEGEGRRAMNPLRLFQPSPQKVRGYIEACFGRSLLSPEDRDKLERRLCTGVHRSCYLHLTRGEFDPGEDPDPERRFLREDLDRQRAANLRHYRDNQVRYHTALVRLTERIRNAALLRLEPDQLHSRAGRLQPGLLWRELYLRDPRVFRKELGSELGDLTVDLLLDGSASQRDRHEQVAAQGYLIAESLTRCGIPVRVSSFCSVSGCTVLRLFRDYDEERGSRNIFDFSAAGWNRDGLAFRAMGALMDQAGSDHRLLIVLSDASPNDDQKLPGRGPLPGRDYTGPLAVEDVAREVSALRRRGVRVLCVFTGRDDELPAAQAIYGRDVARIPSITLFADIVGRLIQTCLRDL